MLDGGRRRVKKYMELFWNRPGGNRSSFDLFHLRDGFEIEVNFDRNVSCLIAVDVFMDNDFFNQRFRVAASSSVMSAYS